MKSPSVLAVDDSVNNIDLVVGALRTQYSISVATNGHDALFLALEEQPDLILLDVMMPEINGYDVCRSLKQDPRTREIPVIFLTALHDDMDEAMGLKLGAVDYITKPFNPELLRRRVETHISLKTHRDRLEDLVAERTKQLNLTRDTTIEIAGNLAEYRDPETGGHIRRTQNYVRCLAHALRNGTAAPAYPLDDDHIDLLVKSAPLHDIGKVGVPDAILLKPGKLTPEEFDTMKQHTIYGRDIITASEKRLGNESFLRIAREIAYSHHEWWDGTGYPLGLKGKDIPLAGRLMALADVYDALISKRAYKPAFSHHRAVRIITEAKGSHFDPKLVDLFLIHEKAFHRIANEFEDPPEPIIPIPPAAVTKKDKETCPA
ncbi:MAG TPA: two-component system response regulator [Desulfobacteraceae bacterium]|nr:two-component system response regulator [Desulfobacteraceae bacterium]